MVFDFLFVSHRFRTVPCPPKEHGIFWGVQGVGLSLDRPFVPSFERVGAGVRLFKTYAGILRGATYDPRGTCPLLRIIS